MPSELTGSAGLAIVLALLSAGSFAVSNSLQHREAGQVVEEHGSFGLLLRLTQRPMWLVGSSIGLVAFSLHAVALAVGSIAAVQPIMILGVVVAVPIRSALDRTRPSASEFFAVVLSCVGVVSLVFLASTEADYAAADPLTTMLFGASCLLATSMLLSLPRIRRKASTTGPAFAAAAGLMFGFSALLMKLLGTSFHAGGAVAVLSSWALWTLLAVGLTGLALNQRAYNLARISQTMPMLNAVDVSVAILAGWIVFGATPPLGPVQVVGYPCALAAVVVGLRLVGQVLEEDPRTARAATPDREGSGIA